MYLKKKIIFCSSYALVYIIHILFAEQVYGSEAFKSCLWTRCGIQIIESLSNNSCLAQGTIRESSCGKGKSNVYWKVLYSSKIGGQILYINTSLAFRVCSTMCTTFPLVCSSTWRCIMIWWSWMSTWGYVSCCSSSLCGGRSWKGLGTRRCISWMSSPQRLHLIFAKRYM